MNRRTLLLQVLPLLLVPAAAVGQTRPPEIQWSPPRAPRPFVMADLSDTRLLGAEVSWGVMGEGDVQAYLLDVVIDYALSPTLKFFGRIPFVYADFNLPFQGDDSGSALGNVQAGARVISPLGPDKHAGATLQVSLPTGPSPFSGSGTDGLAAAAGTNLHLPDDLGRYFGDILTVRAGGDLRLLAGKGFVQGGALVNMFFYTGDEDVSDEQVNYLYLFAGGGAFLTPELAVMAELATWADAFDELDGGENFRHSLSLGLRYEAGSASIGGRFTFYPDESARDDGMRMLTLDVMARLP